MTVFSSTGDVDPFLHVALNKGEKIYCESDAMVMMEATLDLKGSINGGIGAAVLRRFANGESFFQQQIEAVRGDGDCLLSPTLPGAIEIIDVGTRQYLLNDGAFVAATSGTVCKTSVMPCLRNRVVFLLWKLPAPAKWLSLALARCFSWKLHQARTSLLITLTLSVGIALYTMKFL